MRELLEQYLLEEGLHQELLQQPEQWLLQLLLQGERAH